MGIVDNAVYVNGRRHAEPDSLDVTYEVLRQEGDFAWIGLYRPDEQELHSVANEFGIHALAVEDAITAHQRPKIERYSEALFTVLRPARYVDADERVEIGELHVLTGKDFVVTIRHAETPDLAAVRRRLEGSAELLKLGPEAVLYAVLDQVVDEYAPVLAGVQNDIDEIEDQVFSGDPDVSRRIYQLSREVIALQRATEPLSQLLTALAEGFAKYGVHEELQRYLRDVHDHALRVREQVDGFRALLQGILTVNSTLVAERQNAKTQALTELSFEQGEQVKRISSWAAILFAPTLVGTIYGMNFTYMPELDWRAGYPAALIAMASLSAVLYLVFKRKGWI